MKSSISWMPCAAGALLLGFAGLCSAQSAPIRGTIIVPQSSIERSGDIGIRAHTASLAVPFSSGGTSTAAVHTQASPKPPYPGYYFDTPASIACVYDLHGDTRGFCDPNIETDNPTGGSKAIALVDAYDDPNAAHDLATFSRQFGLPYANLTVVFARGYRPPVDPTGGWEFEESLDTQWSHALAPYAAIYLVEAASNSFSDLFQAESVAGRILAKQYGAGEISNGWGGSEFSGEQAYDGFFTTPGVVYSAAIGDAPGVDYPATSPNVIAAGGTSVNRDLLVTPPTLNETAWQDSGGGPSAFEYRPSYQYDIKGIVGTYRGTPDVSVTSNPNNGVWVYDSFPFEVSVSIPPQFSTGWFVAGGTSVATTMLAGMLNSRGTFAASSADELQTIYGNLGSANFFDIIAGNCGPYGGYSAVNGWDFCTGVGSPDGLDGF